MQLPVHAMTGTAGVGAAAEGEAVAHDHPAVPSAHFRFSMANSYSDFSLGCTVKRNLDFIFCSLGSC